MNYQRLAELMPAEDKDKMLELYSTKYLTPSQDALFALWNKHTGANIRISCNKCRARLLKTISRFLQTIR
jgi:hypothetical protein